MSCSDFPMFSRCAPHFKISNVGGTEIRRTHPIHSKIGVLGVVIRSPCSLCRIAAFRTHAHTVRFSTPLLTKQKKISSSSGHGDDDGLEQLLICWRIPQSACNLTQRQSLPHGQRRTAGAEGWPSGPVCCSRGRKEHRRSRSPARRGSASRAS